MEKFAFQDEEKAKRANQVDGKTNWEFNYLIDSLFSLSYALNCRWLRFSLSSRSCSCCCGSYLLPLSEAERTKAAAQNDRFEMWKWQQTKLHCRLFPSPSRSRLFRVAMLTILLFISWKWISQTLSTTSSDWNVTKPKPETREWRKNVNSNYSLKLCSREELIKEASWRWWRRLHIFLLLVFRRE